MKLRLRRPITMWQRLWDKVCASKYVYILGYLIIFAVWQIVNNRYSNSWLPTDDSINVGDTETKVTEWPDLINTEDSSTLDDPIGGRSKATEAVMPGTAVASASTYSVSQVCIIANNKRLASMFHLNLLKQRGRGSIDYFVVDQDNKLKCPVGIPRVKMEFPIFTKSNLQRMFDVLIVEGDELCKCQSAICSDTSKSMFRQYYSKTFEEEAQRNGRQPSIYMPLGPRVEFGLVGRNEIVASSARTLLFNAIMSPTSGSRAILVDELSTDESKLALSSYNFKLHVTKRWHKELVHPGDVSPSEYRETVLDSQFTLCPAGKSPETFRLFEAVEAGSIPVVVLDKEYKEHPCNDAFGPILATNPPFVILSDWKELIPTLSRIASDENALNEMQAKVLEWNTNYWTTFSTLFECIVENSFYIRHGVVDSEQFVLSEPYNSMRQNGNHDIQVALSQCELAMSQKYDTRKQRLNIPGTFLPKNFRGSFPLVTGCGRSGTLTAKATLESLGFPSVHEGVAIGKVSVSWLYAAPDADEYPFESPKSSQLRLKARAASQTQGLPLFSPVVHLVRHPLKVISSVRRCFCGRGTRDTNLGDLSDYKSWVFLSRHIQVPDGARSSVIRAATYWLEWNKLVALKHGEQMLVAPLRLEDLDPIALAQGLGKQVSAAKALKVQVTSAAQHTSKGDDRYPPVTWSELYELNSSLASAVWELAQSYGYELGTTLREQITT